MWRGNDMEILCFMSHTAMYISSHNLFRDGWTECTRVDDFKSFHIVSIEGNTTNALNNIANKILPTYINNIAGIDVRINIAGVKHVFLRTLIYMYILKLIRKCVCQLFKLLRIQRFKFRCTSKLFYRYLQSPYFFVFINMYV